MKFVALFLLVGALAWSWSGYKREALVPVSTHYQLQEEMKNLIAEVIASNVQGAKNLEFKKFWTEPTQTDLVRAVFEYSFDSAVATDDAVRSSLRGVAFLKPSADKSSWTLEKVEIEEESAEFEKGVFVQPGATPTQTQ